MFKSFFKAKTTRKRDVALGVAGALVGIWNAIDTYRDYRAEQDRNNDEAI